MSDENSSSFGRNVPVVAVVVATAVLSIIFLVMGGGFARQQLWSDASAAELAAFDRANPGQAAAAPPPGDQQPSHDPEPALQVGAE